MKLFKKEINNSGNNTMFKRQPYAQQQPTAYNIVGKSVDPARAPRAEYGNSALTQQSKAANDSHGSQSNLGSDKAVNYMATVSKHHSPAQMQAIAQEIMQSAQQTAAPTA